MTAAFELQRVLTRERLVFTTAPLAKDAFALVVRHPEEETRRLLLQFVRRKRKWRLGCSRTKAMTFSLIKIK